MKKLALCFALTAALSSTAYATEVFKGARVGVGYTHSEVESEKIGNGFKAEIAYDFNQILGVQASYEQTNDTIDSIDVDTQVLKFGTDLGYAFQLQKVFLKPYIKVGYQFYEAQVLNIDLADDDDLFYGIGLRFQFEHFYADLSFDKSEVNNLVNVNADTSQTSFTVGYKF